MNSSKKININDKALRTAVKDLRVVNEKAKEGVSGQLIEDSETVHLQVTLKIADDRKDTPVLVKLPNPIFNPADGDNAILFVTDSDTTTKEYLSDVPVTGVEKVLSIDKARKNFATFQLKRDLMKGFKVFLADQAIIPMVPSIIGKKAMDAKRHAIPVAIKGCSASALAANVKTALSCTQMFLFGTVICVRSARLDHSDDEIVANVKAVLDSINAHIPFMSIDNIMLRLNKGKVIPLYKINAEESVKVSLMPVEVKKSLLKEEKEQLKKARLTKAEPKKIVEKKEKKEKK